MSQSPVFDLAEIPVHLGLGASVLRQPAFSGMQWYEEYGARTTGDGAEGRLVSIHTFSEPWDAWEMHPHGDELVVCLAGRIRLHQEVDGKVMHVNLNSYQAVVNPKGVWHTADVEGSATALFITAGLGTEHRARAPAA